MLLGSLRQALTARHLPNPIAGNAVTELPNTLLTIKRSEAAVEAALLRHFSYVDDFVVSSVFYWAHLYLTCTDNSFELYTNYYNESDQHGS